MFRELFFVASGAMRRSMLAACATVALVVLVLSAIAPSAFALTVRDSSFVTDGSVVTMASTGSTLFLGGSFTRVGPFTGSAVVLDAANPVPMFPMLSIPNLFHSQVLSAASDSAGGWFLGGSFVQAQGQPHVRLLHVRADGSIADWAPAPNGNVTALLFTAGRLYVAGAFTNIGGEDRSGLAVIDTGTAAAQAWNPVPASGTVRNFLLANGKLYVYGSFRLMNGEARASIAVFDPVTGAFLPDVPAGPDRLWSSQVHSMAASADRLFLSGDFSYLSLPTGSFARIDTASGSATAPFADLTGAVHAIVPDGAGGWFVGGTVSSAHGVGRTNLLHLNADGSLAPWAPAPDGDVRALALCGDTLFVGGAFQYVGGQYRPGFAAVHASTGALLTATPTAGGQVNALARSGDRLFVGGSFNFFGSTTRQGLASLDWRTLKLSAEQPWGCGSGVSTLLTTATDLYAGGYFTTITSSASGFTRTDTTGASTDPTPLGIGGTGYALAEDGAGGWYVGGTFASSGSVVTNVMQRNADGSLGTFSADANGTVRVLVRSGNTLYLGGTFTTVNGQPRIGVAAVDVVSGALLPFDAALSAAASVRTLALANDTLYIGGAFTAVGGQPRAGLARVDATTGAVSSWAPDVVRNPGTPEVQKVTVANGRVWIAGRFTAVAGLSHIGVASLDPVTGAPNAWTPSVITNQECTIEVSGSKVFVGGDFTNVNGSPISYFAALDATTGAVIPGWSIQPISAVRALRLVGNTLYLAGQFTIVNAQVRYYAAAVNATTGALLPYAPTLGSFAFAIEPSGGQIGIAGAFTVGTPVAVNNLAGFSLATLAPTGFAPNVNGPVSTLASADGIVYVGGEFTSINALTRLRIGALNPNGTLTSWVSNSSPLVYSIAAYGSRLYIGGEVAGKGSLRAVSRVTGTVVAFNPAPSAPVYAVHASTSLVAGCEGGGFGGAARTMLGSLSLATGLPTTWNPTINLPPSSLLWTNGTLFAGGPFTSIASASHRYLAAWNTSTNALLALDPVPDGAVTTLALMNDTLFVGGAFSYFAGSPRRRLAALSASTFALLGLDPGADGTVNLVAADRGRVVAAGAFQSVGMSARGGLAAVDLRTGFVRPWDPQTAGPVSEIHLLGGRLYAVGSFYRSAAPARTYAAAFDTATAEPSPWAPEPDGSIFSFVPHAGHFFVGGTFTNVGGAARSSIAQVDTATGAATSWNPGTNGTPIRLAVDSDTLFVGGAFSTIGGQPRGNAASFDAASGALTPWNPAANNQVTAFEFQSGQVFVGGAFTSIGGATRSKLALLSRSTGLATPWNAGISTGATHQVDVLDLSNGFLFVGGSFLSVANGAAPRTNFALLNAVTAAPIAWAPEPWSGVHALLRDRGTLHVGGFFTNIAGVAHPYYAALLDPTYQLELLDAPGAERASTLSLAVPFPNPAQTRTRLAFTLPAAGRVRLGLFDVNGRRVASVLSGDWLEAGRHQRVLDTSRFSPGVYWTRLEFGGRIQVRSLTIRP